MSEQSTNGNERRDTCPSCGDAVRFLDGNGPFCGSCGWRADDKPRLATDGGSVEGGVDRERSVVRGFQTRGMEPQRNIYDFQLTIDAAFADELRSLQVPDKQEQAADHIEDAITHDMADVRFVGETFLLRGVTVGFDAASLDIHKEMHGRQRYATHNIDNSSEAIEVIAAVSRWEELANHLLEDQRKNRTVNSATDQGNTDE